MFGGQNLVFKLMFMVVYVLETTPKFSVGGMLVAIHELVLC